MSELVTAILGGVGAIAVIAAVILAVLLIKHHRKDAPQTSSGAHHMPSKATGDGAQLARIDDAEPLLGSQNITLPDVLKFEIGAYLVYGIIKNHIHGTVQYREGKYRWVEYYLTDTSWLGADKEEAPRLISWERVIPSDLEPNGKKSITFQGVTYHYVERSKAEYEAFGETGDLTGRGTVEYADYETPDGQNFLSFERYDGEGDWEVAIGEMVLISMIDYYPPGAPLPESALG